MTVNSIDTNRLLIELDRTMRTLNREVLNPEIPKLTMKGLEPTLRMVAIVRSAYLQAVLELAEISTGKIPDPQQIAELRKTRECYEELLSGAKAIETAIKRGYLDVEGSCAA